MKDGGGDDGGGDNGGGAALQKGGQVKPNGVAPQQLKDGKPQPKEEEKKKAPNYFKTYPLSICSKKGII